MNKQQRKQISQIIDRIENYADENNFNECTDWTWIESRIEEAHVELESIRDEEQDKYDNMPESLQGGSKGDDMQGGIENLESALEALESAMEACKVGKSLTAESEKERSAEVAEMVAEAISYLEEL